MVSIQSLIHTEPKKKTDIPLENSAFGGSAKGSPTATAGGKTTLQPTQEGFQGSPLRLQCKWDTLRISHAKAKVFG